MKALGNYIACCYRALNGLKTYLMALAIILVGLSEYYSVTDLKPVFEHYLGAERASLLAIWIPLIFIGLRWLTDGKAKGRKDDGQDEGF